MFLLKEGEVNGCFFLYLKEREIQDHGRIQLPSHSCSVITKSWENRALIERMIMFRAAKNRNT